MSVFAYLSGRGVSYSPSFLFSSRLNSRISPGWQSRTSHIASSVEKRMALTFPVFILDRFTFASPTLSDNSLSDIFLSAITRSSRKIIAMAHLTEFHRKAFVVVCHTQIYRRANKRQAPRLSSLNPKLTLFCTRECIHFEIYIEIYIRISR